MRTTDPATIALAKLTGFSDCNTWSAKSDSTNIPASTLWHRANGRRSKEEQAQNQQYLTITEEKSLVSHALRSARNGFPVPLKSFCSLAYVIVRRRSSEHHIPTKPPSAGWTRKFFKRNPEIKPRKSKPIDWKRHDHNIRSKAEEWFSVIGPEIQDPAIDSVNVYNMDETGVMLSNPRSLKVLVGKDYDGFRGARVKRETITAIECISADGRSLHPLIIWPAATHRSTWTTHPTPGWHFAHSKSGYNDSVISLYWIKHVFDPQTKALAGNKPRLLISDGFGTHESLEILEFCYENCIILCRLPSHTSHKLQPCDVGVFSSLKTAYRGQAELLDRGGANTIGKQHFTYLYSRARDEALTRRNILSGWSKTGLRPFNPERVLASIQKPPLGAARLETNVARPPATDKLPETPASPASLLLLRSKVEDHSCVLDERARLHLQKVLNATERAFAERSLLLQQNQVLFQQNNEKKNRQHTKSTVVGKAKIMTFEDIVMAKRKREEKEAARGSNKRKRSTPAGEKGSTRVQRVEESNQSQTAHGIEEYCSVIDFRES